MRYSKFGVNMFSSSCPYASCARCSDDALRRGMADLEMEAQTRSQFKYGCLHGVHGTPQVYIGGVLADNLDGGATFEDWKALLDPLLVYSTPYLSTRLSGPAARFQGGLNRPV